MPYVYSLSVRSVFIYLFIYLFFPLDRCFLLLNLYETSTLLSTAYLVPLSTNCMYTFRGLHMELLYRMCEEYCGAYF